MYYLDPAAPWADQIGANTEGKVFAPALAATVQLTFDDQYADVNHDEIWEAVIYPLDETFDAAGAVSVDHDDRDFNDEPPEGASYMLPEARIDQKTYPRMLARRWPTNSTARAMSLSSRTPN